jgi:c-di-GMP-binding flagellar brake protein YcgR
MAFLAKIKALFRAEKELTHSDYCSVLKELLRTVQQDRVPIQVRLTNARPSDMIFNSYILRVDEDGGSTALEIDELVPREGNEWAKASGKLTVMVNHQGTQATFIAPITQFSGTYLTPLPKSLDLYRKRSTKRLKLSDLGNFPVEIYSEGRALVLATLTDVSLGGLQLRVRLSDSVTPPFRQGEIIHGIHLTVGGGHQVQLQVEIRSVSLKRAQRSILLGAKIRGFKDDKDEEVFSDWVSVIHGHLG